LNKNLQAVHESLQQRGIEHHLDETNHGCYVRIDLAGASTWLGVRAEPEDDWITVVLSVPITAPADRRAAVGEFLLRTNSTLSAGSFELDFDNGEILFRIVLLLAGAPFPREALGRAIVLATVSADGYLPALKQVAFEGMNPRLALEQGEGYVRDLLKRMYPGESQS